MKKNVCSFLFLFFCICLFSQNVIKKEEIPIYIIQNNDFGFLLDSFIFNENKYSYFNDSLVFFLNVLNQNGTVFELLSGEVFEDNIPFIYKYQKEKAGFFTYNNYKFIIVGRGVISDSIMIKTNEYTFVRTIKIYDSINALDDDSYFPTSWIINFENNFFKIVNKTERHQFHE